ncbi:replication-associated recombination protein A [Patescibacteria group bacterium]|nr:replication-associated recombination protein A [Patescibacteria group bacterium]
MLTKRNNSADLWQAALDDLLKKEAPLADRLRPLTWDEFEGQLEVVGPDKLLRRLLEKDEVPSLIFWGPPGTGKTTLARIIASVSQSYFVQMSAVSSGLADLRTEIKQAIDRRKLNSLRTILFVDEIHRWNKAQQDALLPYVENGAITLIGATTENPSFEVISALLSRVRVIVLQSLSADNLKNILKRALVDKERGLGNYKITGVEQAVDYIANLANGDSRLALNVLELAVKSSLKNNQAELTEQVLQQSLQRTHLKYDKNGQEHYNLISALHKSLRGSDANAALYWLARMLEAGGEPLYVARRLVRFASEDIGLADPNALLQAVAAFQAAHQLGMPECNVALAQATVYLAKAPKSNALYKAYLKVQEDVFKTIDDSVPLHLRNAPTKLMKNLGYGKGYKYNPDFKEPVDQDYLPDNLKGKKYLE